MVMTPTARRVTAEPAAFGFPSAVSHWTGSRRPETKIRATEQDLWQDVTTRSQSRWSAGPVYLFIGLFVFTSAPVFTISHLSNFKTMKLCATITKKEKKKKESLRNKYMKMQDGQFASNCQFFIYLFIFLLLSCIETHKTAVVDLRYDMNVPHLSDVWLGLWLESNDVAELILKQPQKLWLASFWRCSEVKIRVEAADVQESVSHGQLSLLQCWSHCWGLRLLSKYKHIFASQGCSRTGPRASKRLSPHHHYYNFVLLVSAQVTDSLQNTVTIRLGSGARCFCERGEGDVKTPVWSPWCTVAGATSPCLSRLREEAQSAEKRMKKTFCVFTTWLWSVRQCRISALTCFFVFFWHTLKNTLGVIIQ